MSDSFPDQLYSIHLYCMTMHYLPDAKHASNETSIFRILFLKRLLLYKFHGLTRLQGGPALSHVRS